MLELLKNDDNRKGHGVFRCVCGAEKSIRKSAVKSGGTKSCGCHRRRIAVQNGKCATTHGMSNTPVYTKWAGLKNLCKEWSESFESFYDFVKGDWEAGKTGITIKEGYKKLSPESIILTSINEAKRINTARTSMWKHGVEHHTQLEEVKSKARKTNMDRYGGSPSSNEEVKEKIRQTCLRKYGVDHYSKSDEGRQKARSLFQVHDGKTGKELAEDIGVSASHMNKMIREHGYEHAIQYERNYTFIESVIANILNELGVRYEQNVKIGDKFADFVLPDHMVVIEADGLYWHSDAINKDNRYHINKRFLYQDLGYKPLFFREDEIHNRTTAVKSVIQNAVRKCQKVFARKCNIVELTKNESKFFFTSNHLMGAGRGRCFGLEYEGEVVCAMQIVNKQAYTDISRFCTRGGWSVVGGFSRLIKKIEREINPRSIQTFVDMRYGTGEYLKSLGFTKKSEHISFRWIKNCESVHRMKFSGNSGYEKGWSKIWDCGQSKFVKS